jgi:hypothetical protein
MTKGSQTTGGQARRQSYGSARQAGIREMAIERTGDKMADTAGGGFLAWCRHLAGFRSRALQLGRAASAEQAADRDGPRPPPRLRGSRAEAEQAASSWRSRPVTVRAEDGPGLSPSWSPTRRRWNSPARDGPTA